VLLHLAEGNASAATVSAANSGAGACSSGAASKAASTNRLPQQRIATTGSREGWQQDLLKAA
jgi:hypothetical protein